MRYQIKVTPDKNILQCLEKPDGTRWRWGMDSWSFLCESNDPDRITMDDFKKQTGCKYYGGSMYIVNNFNGSTVVPV